MPSSSIQDLNTLLVEPSSSQCRIIRSYMESLGVTDIRWVRNGSDALEQLRRVPSDLVVSAMHFPDMTGVDLLHTLRHDASLADIPFLLISSETHYRYLEPIRQAGTIAILPKPFAVEQLKRALYSTLDFHDPGVLNTSAVELDSLQVLIVDDSALSRRHIRKLLQNLGIANITEAENGRAAQELVNDRFFDLVVTDYHMPEMDGKELVEYIRSGSGQASVPILMISGEADAGRLAAVQQAGVSAICDKPFDASSIKHVIEQLLA